MGRSRFLGPALAIAVLGAQALPSLPALAATSTVPFVIQPLKTDTSPALRTMHASPVPPEGKGSQPNRPLHPGRSGAKLPTASKSIQTTAGAASMPSTSANFEGVNNIDGVLPPDTNGDVGPNDYVQWVNLHFEIFGRTGASLKGPSAGNTLWSGFGGLCEFTNQGDPVVRYDRMADRWIFTQFAFSTKHGAPVAPYDQCFAVSTTGDPTGSYFRYAWQISNTNFPDYPKLAVWPDAYYMSVNFFSSPTTFVGAGALAFDRNKMLTNQGPTAILFGPTGSNFGGLLPSDLDGSILPPSGSPNYFGAIDTSAAPSGNTFQIWKFHVDFITPANSTFGTASQTPNFNLLVDTYFWNMCNGSRSCIQQPVTSQGLDPLSDRLMNRLQYRRFADGHESLVANHTVGVGSSGNQGAVRWYEIRGLSTTPTIYQQGTYSPSSDSRWMGSIAMDQVGDIAVGYSVSSSSISPSIRYTGRLAGDPLGTLPQGEASIVAGSGSQTSSFNRWGDYSMMAVDPTDDCAFWYTQEYYTATSTASWRTRVASFKFPSCGQPWYASYGTANTPTSWAANQTQTYSVTITNAGNQTWPAGGSNPVHLGVHFATSGGGEGVSGWAAGNGWFTDQRFTLPADLAPGGSTSLTIAATAPSNSGNLVLEYQMVKEQEFWFGQFADVNVTVAAPTWSAIYTVTNTPISWAVNQTQTYSVTITNAGNQTWPAGGTNPVHLGVHFATTGGGQGVSGWAAGNGWFTDQRFTLPADLAPGGSTSLTIAVTAPSNSGNLVLEYQMVKEQQFWFGQFADVTVTLAAPTWIASYGVANTPASWAANQSQTYSVTLTNNGNQTWQAAGTNPVHLGVHFAATGGGEGVSGWAVGNGWFTDQRFNLPADLAPGGSITLTITVTAPSNSGSLVLEYQMVKEQQFWFGQFADVTVIVI